jgi:hypothetical protein
MDCNSWAPNKITESRPSMLEPCGKDLGRSFQRKDGAAHDLCRRDSFLDTRKLMAELLEESSERPRNVWKVWLKIGKEDHSI